MKTNIPKLSKLISSCKFDYSNPNIVDGFFEQPKEISNDYKLFHFDRYISSEDAIKEMQKEGYRPANVWELLKYNWNNKNWVVALGSVAEVRGVRDVPSLFRDVSERHLHLFDWYGDWGADDRFLAVRNLEIKNSETGKSELELSVPWVLGRLSEIEKIIKSIKNKIQ